MLRSRWLLALGLGGAILFPPRAPGQFFEQVRKKVQSSAPAKKVSSGAKKVSSGLARVDPTSRTSDVSRAAARTASSLPRVSSVPRSSSLPPVSRIAPSVSRVGSSLPRVSGVSSVSAPRASLPRGTRIGGPADISGSMHWMATHKVQPWSAADKKVTVPFGGRDVPIRGKGRIGRAYYEVGTREYTYSDAAVDAALLYTGSKVWEKPVDYGLEKAGGVGIKGGIKKAYGEDGFMPRTGYTPPWMRGAATSARKTSGQVSGWTQRTGSSYKAPSFQTPSFSRSSYKAPSYSSPSVKAPSFTRSSFKTPSWR